MTLYWHALRQQVTSLVLWLIGLLFMVQVVVSAASVMNAVSLGEVFDKMPAALRALAGGDLALRRPLDGYLNAKLLWYFPLLFAIFVAFQASAMLAREAEQHRFDFLLGLPVTRSRLLLSRFAAVLTAVALLWALLIGGLLAMLRSRGLPVDATGYWLVAWAGFLVDACFAAVSLWISAGAGEYRRALQGGLVAALVPYVVDLTLQMSQAPRGWRWLQPYGYYDPPQLLLQHAFPWLSTLVLGAAAAAAVFLARRTFQRREV